MLIAQMAMYYKNKGRNLVQQLEVLFKRYGYHEENTVSYKIEAVIPQQRMDEIMKGLRGEIPTAIGGKTVVEFRDYKKHIIKDLRTGEEIPNSQKVLDGGIDPFINAYLKWTALGNTDKTDKTGTR